MSVMKISDDGQGNVLFSEGKYEQALASYSHDIISGLNDATLHTNRAVCYLKLGQWQEAIGDCQQAIQIDSSLVKGHFFMGQALVELKKFDDALVCLKTAHELAKQQRKNFGEDITAAVRYARKMRWKSLEEKRVQEGTEFHTFLADLLTQHREKLISQLEATGPADSHSTSLDRIHEEHEGRIAQLTNLFQEADEKRKCREVPDYLCGKISFELMVDPYVTPSGITYDRKDIEGHLQRVGHFDPVTRQELSLDQLIPNLAMKEVVDAFAAQNNWIADY